MPWDSEIFGFPVAVYRIADERLDSAEVTQFPELFRRWVYQEGARLCACTIAASESHSFGKYLLAKAGFHFVDFSLQTTLNGLQKTTLPKCHSKLRLAELDDFILIEAIARQAFRNGRYHSDPLFPRELADKRYCEWIRNALTTQNSIDHVYVMGEPGRVRGFFHVTHEEAVSDLRLAAIEPASRGTPLGFDLYASVLHLLKSHGVNRVLSSISVANTSVLNVYSMLGFSFSAPEMIFHWHPEALQS